MITLEIFSNDGGQRWITFVGEERLGELNDPLTDGARILLERGYDPATKIALKHKGNTYVSLTASLGWAAEHTVKDTPSQPPRFAKYESPETIKARLSNEPQDDQDPS